MKEQTVMSQLVLKSRKGDEMPDALKEMLEGREGLLGDYEGRGRKTPIDKVWLDAFKDEWDHLCNSCLIRKLDIKFN